MNIGIDCRPILYTKAGIAEYTRQLINNSPKECNVSLFAPSRINEKFPIHVKKKIIRMPRINKHFVSLWENNLLPWACKKNKIDVFCGMRFWAPQKGKFKKIVTVHDVAFKKIKGLVPESTASKYEKIIQSSLRYVDHFIAVSETSKVDFCQLYCVPEEKVSVVYNGYDSFYSQEADLEYISAVRKKFGIKKDFYLFVGTIEPRKNLARLLKAYEKLDKNKDIDLVIAGAYGWEYAEFLEVYRKSSVKDKIKTIGYLTKNELSALYHSAAAFLMPSLYEGFGIPVLEAMSAGLPVLTADNSSLGELFSKCSVQVNSYDIDSISDGMNKVIECKEELSIKSVERAKEFSWKMCAENYFDIIKGI